MMWILRRVKHYCYHRALNSAVWILPALSRLRAINIVVPRGRAFRLLAFVEKSWRAPSHKITGTKGLDEKENPPLNIYHFALKQSRDCPRQIGRFRSGRRWRRWRRRWRRSLNVARFQRDCFQDKRFDGKKERERIMTGEITASGCQILSRGYTDFHANSAG